MVGLSPVLTPVKDLGEYIREQRLNAQISLRSLAARAGVSNPYLSQVERGLRRPSAEILAQIARGLSISVESLLTKAGILDGTAAPEVIAAIRADEHLTDRQKASMMDIYQAFINERRGPTDPVGEAAAPAARRVETSVRTRTDQTHGRLPSGTATTASRSAHELRLP